MTNGMLENVKIVVVDHDALTRNFVVNTLMFCVNRHVMMFENGKEAWLYLENHNSADIIIANVHMPVMDGFELLRKTKKQYPHKICILMSANSKDEQQAAELGADAFLAKPFDIQDIFDIVQTFVAGRN